jgi:hypothetical protein
MASTPQPESASNPPLLSVHGLAKAYRGRPVVAGVSIEVRAHSSRRNATGAINAIRFLASTGNINGTFTLFGRL